MDELRSPPTDIELERAQDAQIQHAVGRGARLCGCGACQRPSSNHTNFQRGPCGTRDAIVAKLLAEVQLVRRYPGELRAAFPLVFVVNGSRTEHAPHPMCSLRSAVEHAMHNEKVRIGARYEVRDAAGVQWLAEALDTPISQLGVEPHGEIIVTFPIGSGA